MSITPVRVIHHKRSIFKQIIDLLNGKKNTCRQLLDGTIYIYNKKYMMASFKYTGAKEITDLVLNTKESIGLTFADRVKFYDKTRTDGEELQELLEKMFPAAGEICNGVFKNAVPFTVIEWLMTCTDTQIEVRSTPKKLIYEIYLIHAEASTSSSFRYLPTSGTLDRIWLKYTLYKKPVRIKKLPIPETHLEFFREFVDKHTS